jgi:hypothetical protein
MNAICENQECSEFEILKTGDDSFKGLDVRCGKCGEPVTEVSEADDDG